MISDAYGHLESVAFLSGDRTTAGLYPFGGDY